MTVCTASIFAWNNGGTAGLSPAVITASDRRLTDSGLGIGYESSKFKGGTYATGQLILVSGEITVASSIIRALIVRLRDPCTGAIPPTIAPDVLCHDVSNLIVERRLEEAGRLYLAPLGLDADTFVARQRKMEPTLVGRLAKQMQDYRFDSEVLIAASYKGESHLFRIDNSGSITNHSDIGFLSIGCGGIHSSAYFMTLPYNHLTAYYRALYHTYAAKRRAEVDPYVGKSTDMFLITQHGGVSKIPDDVIGELEKIYEDTLTFQRQIPDVAEKRLMDVHKGIWDQPVNLPPTELSDSHSN
jgi:hypothetical protein